MKARVLGPAITFATVSAVLLAVLAVYLTFTASSEVHADLGQYDATHTQTLDSAVPGADRGAVTTLRVPLYDHNFASNTTLDPAGVTYTYGCNETGYRDLNDNGINDGPPETPCLAAGDSSGTQTSAVKLGLANNACLAPLVVVHNLFSVKMPNDEDDPRASTNIAWPKPQGSSNRYEVWKIGSEPTPPGFGDGTATLDADSNTRAEGGTISVQNYPKYLLDIFDPDGSNDDGVDNDGDTLVDEAGEGAAANPVVPIAVYGGLTAVTGTWVPLYYAQFAAGQLNTAFAGREPDPFTRFISAPAANSQGHPSVAVLNDPSALRASPSTITDFCGDLSASNDSDPLVGGISRAKNPATPGTHFTLVSTASIRDTDNDGYENAFDTCPRIANLDDPRVTTGADLDGFSNPAGDMIDPACDPTPSGVGSAAPDPDGDLFPAAQDNCPLVSNPLQADTEIGADYAKATFDGGVQPDQMGSGCDAGNTVSASGSTLSPAMTDTVGSTMVYTGADVFAAGDYIQIDSEIMRISDVTTATNTLIVGRGAAGTTAATHANLAPISDVLAITVTLNGVSTPVVFADAASTGAFHLRGNVIPICYSTAPVDADGDGYCASGTAGCAGACIVDTADSGACTTPPAGSTNATCNVRHSAWTTTASMALLLVNDTDRGGGDTAGASDAGGIGTPILCPGGASDLCPENAFDSDWLETYLGTKPAQACAQNSGLNNELFDSWAYDFNDDQRANLSDITAMGTAFNRFVNHNFPSTGAPGFASAITLTGALGSSILVNTTLVYTGADVVAAGDYITIGTEVMRVNGVDTATNTLDVARGVLGAPSPAAASAAHAAAAPILKTIGPRMDINSDGVTNLSDVTAFGPFFNKQCRRVDGTFGAAQ